VSVIHSPSTWRVIASSNESFFSPNGMNGANIGANIVCFRPSNCKRCTGRVYEAEKVVAASEVWHKCCFRCLRCGRSLEPGKFSDRAGEIYCNSREFLLVLKLSTQEAGIHYFWDNTKQLLCQEFSPKVQTDFAIMYTVISHHFIFLLYFLFKDIRIN